MSGIAAWLAESLALQSVYERRKERGSEGRALVGPVPNEPVQFLEHGLKFTADVVKGQKTGFFLDQRDNRHLIRQLARGRSVLNLFAYTGSFTVHALAGGATETTTVDLSNTYCEWAERNLRLNGFEPGNKHQVIRADVLGWLEQAKGQFDLIVLDPPSFSSSKKMGRRFEVQRDHRWLVERTRELLSPTGVLYFSTNFLTFELDARFRDAQSLDSLPGDFRRTVQRCWRFVGPGGGAKAVDQTPAAPGRSQKHGDDQHPAKRR